MRFQLSNDSQRLIGPYGSVPPSRSSGNCAVTAPAALVAPDSWVVAFGLRTATTLPEACEPAPLHRNTPPTPVGHRRIENRPLASSSIAESPGAHHHQNPQRLSNPAAKTTIPGPIG